MTCFLGLRDEGVWNIDPITRGLKLKLIAIPIDSTIAVWNIDPITRGLKLGRHAVFPGGLLDDVWNIDPITRGLKL